MQKHKTRGISLAFLTTQALVSCTDVPATHTQWIHTHVRVYTHTHTSKYVIVHPLVGGPLKSHLYKDYFAPLPAGDIWQCLET